MSDAPVMSLVTSVTSSATAGSARKEGLIIGEPGTTAAATAEDRAAAAAPLAPDADPERAALLRPDKDAEDSESELELRDRDDDRDDAVSFLLSFSRSFLLLWPRTDLLLLRLVLRVAAACAKRRSIAFARAAASSSLSRAEDAADDEDVEDEDASL
jgi:hypothetical protein